MAMSEKCIRVCDKCGATIGEWGETTWARIAAKVDRKVDGAGGMENMYLYVDLCVECLSEQLQKEISELSSVTARAWARGVGAKGPEA